MNGPICGVRDTPGSSELFWIVPKMDTTANAWIPQSAQV